MSRASKRARQGASESGVERFYWGLKGLRDLATVLLGGAVGGAFTMWTTFDNASMLTFPALWWAIGALIVGVLLLIGLMSFLKPTYKDARATGGRRAHPAAGGAPVTAEHDRHAPRRRASVVEDGHPRGRACLGLHGGARRVRADLAALVEPRLRTSRTKGLPTQNSSAATREDWEAECVESGGFTPDEAGKLTMSSRSILALRLDTTSDEKLGMLVLESENEDKFTARNGAELRRSTVYRAMVDILAASHTQLPRVLERAQERAGAKNAERLLEEPVWKNSTHRT